MLVKPKPGRPSAFWSVPKEWGGATVVIYGGGPSLNLADIDYARQQGWKRIACNDSFRLDDEADVMCWGDQRWYRWNHKAIRLHRGQYKITWRETAQLDDPEIRVLKAIRRPPPHISKVPTEIVSVCTGQGAMNLAYLFGVHRIILLGFDMREIRGRHNWHTYHREGTPPTIYKHKHMPAMTAAGQAIVKLGVEIINATPGSALKAFPIVHLREIHG